MTKKILWFLLINALAVYAVAQILGPENFLVSSDSGEILGLVSVGFVLGILNAIVRPILGLLSLPLVILTFGLFLTIINAGLLWFTEFLFTEILSSFHIIFEISGGFLSYIIAAICFSIINSILHFFGK